MRVIRAYARRIAQRFQPDKIVLFGSYAYGTPHAASDVDILVIMPARNEIDQAFKIRCEVPTQFPMDLLVLKPRNVAWRLAERESFVTEILERGRILYEKDDPRSRCSLRSSGGLASLLPAYAAKKHKNAQHDDPRNGLCSQLRFLRDANQGGASSGEQRQVDNRHDAQGPAEELLAALPGLPELRDGDSNDDNSAHDQTFVQVGA